MQNKNENSVFLSSTFYILKLEVNLLLKKKICNVRYITHDSYAISVVPPFNRL